MRARIPHEYFCYLMNDDQLSLLSKTIATHAREVAGKEWKDEHRPVLISILTRAGLGNLDEGMLMLQDKEVPIKVIVTALHEQFLQARLPTGANGGLGTNKVIESAMRDNTRTGKPYALKMTAREIYDLTLRGGGNDFQATVELLERLDVPWCLIGGLAVDAYAEPAYTADADFVIVSTKLEFVCAELAGLGFTISHHFGVNARLPGSGFVVRLDDRSALPRFHRPRLASAEALGVQCRVAALAAERCGQINLDSAVNFLP